MSLNIWGLRSTHKRRSIKSITTFTTYTSSFCKGQCSTRRRFGISYYTFSLNGMSMSPVPQDHQEESQQYEILKHFILKLISPQEEYSFQEIEKDYSLDSRLLMFMPHTRIGRSTDSKLKKMESWTWNQQYWMEASIFHQRTPRSREHKAYLTI